MLMLLCACQPGGVGSVSPPHPTESTGPVDEESGFSFPSAGKALESAEYQVVESFQTANYGPGSPAKHNLWAALIQDIAPY